MNVVRVRQAKTIDAKKLELFFKEAYGEMARYKYPERWEWLFLRNPWQDPDDLQIYIAEENEKIVGHAAAYIVPCKIHNKTVQLSWGIDSIVLPQYRGRGVAKALQSLNKKKSQIGASFSMSPVIRKVKKKLGFNPGPPAYLYIRYLGFSNSAILSRYNSGLVKILMYFPTVILYGALAIIQNSRINKLNAAYKIIYQNPPEFGSDETILWKKVRKDYAFGVERTAEYLNWRYKEEPWGKHFCFKTYDDQDNLNGLLIYRVGTETNPNVAIILELITIPGYNNISECLLYTMEKHVIKENVRQIQFACGDNKAEIPLKRCGYLKIGEKALIISGSGNIFPDLNRNSSIILTTGDQDADQFPYAKLFSPLEVIIYQLKRHLFPSKL